MFGGIIAGWILELAIFQYWKIFLTQFIAWGIFLFTNNPIIADFAWAFNHVLIGTSLFMSYGCCTVQSIVLYVLLLFWGCRLGGFILTTRVLKNKSDRRYEEVAKNFNNYRRLFFLLNFQAQGLVLMFCASNLFFVFRTPERIGWNFWPGVLLIVTGIIGQAISDQQLLDFKNTREKIGHLDKTSLHKAEGGAHSGKLNLLRDGLWQHSRHPNLFFDLVTWTGFAFTGLAHGEWETLFSFLAPFVLFCAMNFVTIPLTERTMKETRPNFEEFRKSTNKFVPF